METAKDVSMKDECDFVLFEYSVSCHFSTKKKKKEKEKEKNRKQKGNDC